MNSILFPRKARANNIANEGSLLAGSLYRTPHSGFHINTPQRRTNSSGQACMIGHFTKTTWGECESATRACLDRLELSWCGRLLQEGSSNSLFQASVQIGRVGAVIESAEDIFLGSNKASARLSQESCLHFHKYLLERPQEYSADSMQPLSAKSDE